MFELLSEHQFWTAVVIYWIFSAAVSSMPDPAGNGSSGYLWLYRFLHTIAGNITTAFGSKIPGLKTFTLLLVASGCAAGCRHFGMRRALYHTSRSAEQNRFGGLRHTARRRNRHRPGASRLQVRTSSCGCETGFRGANPVL